MSRATDALDILFAAEALDRVKAGESTDLIDDLRIISAGCRTLGAEPAVAEKFLEIEGAGQ